MSGIARALEMSEARGFIKVIVDAGSDQIVGCTVFGIEGGELISMLQIAMIGKLSSKVLKEAIFAYPTLAEGPNNVFLALDGCCRGGGRSRLAERAAAKPGSRRW